MPLTITDYAMHRCGTKHGGSDIAINMSCWYELVTEHEPKMWDDLKANFMEHLDQVNADLKAEGLPQLGNK